MAVRELQPDQRDLFFDLLELSGASFPQAKRRTTNQFYCTTEFRCFVAFDSTNQPAGWATMYVGDGVAFLANAYTLAAYRGKGAHSSLLHARLQLACEMQLTHVFTDVEPASQSHRNCERCGFRLLSVNSIWTRND
jgi:N-acetylglutamate synthase-like GNAT family acetyltransferase